MALQTEVYIDRERHFYFNQKGEQLISWSKFSSHFFPQFDKVKMAPFCVGKPGYEGLTAAQIIKKWETHGTESADAGTQVHDALEHFSNTFQIKPEHTRLEPLVRSIQKAYSDYYRTCSEEILHTKYGIAGTCDKAFKITSHENSLWDLGDYKNWKHGIEYVAKDKVREKFCLFPIQHLPNCNFTKVSLQLSFYAFCMEEMGFKPRKLFVTYIPLEDKMKHVSVVCNYMKCEIQMMIAEYIRQRNAGLLPALNAKPMKTA